jgi:hypothetical protein
MRVKGSIPSRREIAPEFDISARSIGQYGQTDEDDGGWRFLPGGGSLLEENARVVALRWIWLLDPSVGQLADLPLGWQASRRSPLESRGREPRKAGNRVQKRLAVVRVNSRHFSNFLDVFS